MVLLGVQHQQYRVTMLVILRERLQLVLWTRHASTALQTGTSPMSKFREAFGARCEVYSHSSASPSPLCEFRELIVILLRVQHHWYEATRLQWV